MLKKNTNH